MERDKKYINLYLDNETLERIDKYRFDNRFPSRTEAIRHLIQSALPPLRKPAKKTS
jgi:metal-responsive CopG/Arc/MetJ family transcriptional regulator